MADPFFQWHPDARLFGPGGQTEPQVASAGLAPVALAADPPALALARALAAPRPFRIGRETEPPPEPGPVPVFETLTSGSTGTPRRIRRSQQSWTASFRVNAGLFGIGPGRRLAVLGRLEHSLSLYGALEGLQLGADVHLLGGLRPDRQLQRLARDGVDTLYATPAQLRAMCGVDRTKPLAGLRLILVGGSKLDPLLRQGLARLAPAADVREFYGAAEASFITLADADTPEASVGRPYPGVEIDLRQGEVWVRSPYLFQSYASDPGSAQLEDGWLSVGEMGRIADGYLYLSGRKGRMVTIADQNVFPEEIEALMETLPGILRAAVLAEADAARGHVLYAVAQGDAAKEAAILAALRATLGPLKAPRRIVWRRDWPVTAAGKTDLAALRGKR